MSYGKRNYFHLNGKYYKQKIDFSNEISIDKEELYFFKNIEKKIEENQIETLYQMLKPYSIEHFSILYKEWKDVKKEITPIPWTTKTETCPYRYRGMLLSLHKELSLREPLSINIFHDLKKKYFF